MTLCKKVIQLNLSKLLKKKTLISAFKIGLVLSVLSIFFTLFNRFSSDRIAAKRLANYIEVEEINVKNGYRPRIERGFFTNTYIYKLQTDDEVHELLFYVDGFGGFERHRMVFDKQGNRK